MHKWVKQTYDITRKILLPAVPCQKKTQKKPCSNLNDSAEHYMCVFMVRHKHGFLFWAPPQDFTQTAGPKWASICGSVTLKFIKNWNYKEDGSANINACFSLHIIPIFNTWAAVDQPHIFKYWYLREIVEKDTLKVTGKRPYE